MLSLAGFGLGWRAARNYIDCDYDSAGLIAEIDHVNRAPFHAVRPLFTPMVLGVCRAARWLGMSPVFPAFFVLYALVHAATVLMMFVAAMIVSERLWIAALAASMYMVCGSQIYLLRVLEDNLPANLWLSGLVVMIVAEAKQPRKWSGVLAGVCLGMAILFGRHCMAWLPVLLIPAMMPGRTWGQRLRFELSAIGISLALAYFVMISLAAPLGRPEFVTDPYTLFVTRFPEAGLFKTSFPLWVRGRYLLLGIYYALFTLPADMSQEWNMAYSQISKGLLPGIGLHAAAVGTIVLVGGAVLCCRDSGLRRVAAAGMGGLLVLTLLNLSAIDGSFPERFDFVPLLWTPVMAAALAVANRSRRRIWMPPVLLFCIAPIVVNLHYIRIVKHHTRWQYEDMSRLTRLRFDGEPVVIRAAIGNALQYDFMCKAANLWLTHRNTWLIAYPSIQREGSMVVMPEEPDDTRASRGAFYYNRAKLQQHDSFLLNQQALDWLRDEIERDNVQIRPILTGHEVYYRAVRPSWQG